MLEALKKKLSLASADLSTGITRLATRKSPSLPKFPGPGEAVVRSATSLGLSSAPSTSALYPTAGEEVLHHFEEEWRNTRDLSLSNVAAADRVSRHLAHLSSTARQKRLGREAAGLGAVDLGCLAAEMERLAGVCRAVEAGLAELEVLADTAELQGRKLDARFALAMMREQRVNAINDAKGELSASLCEEMEGRARRAAVAEAEKAALYQDAFAHDLGLYKATGLIANTVPSVDAVRVVEVKGLPRAAPGVPLSAVLAPGAVSWGRRPQGFIDDDFWSPADPEALEAFLSDVRMEDSGIAGSDSQSVEGEA